MWNWLRSRSAPGIDRPPIPWIRRPRTASHPPLTPGKKRELKRLVTNWLLSVIPPDPNPADLHVKGHEYPYIGVDEANAALHGQLDVNGLLLQIKELREANDKLLKRLKEQSTEVGVLSDQVVALSGMTRLYRQEIVRLEHQINELSRIVGKPEQL